MIDVLWDDLFEFGVGFLETLGVSRKDAAYIAEIAVDAEAMGISTHGAIAYSYFHRMIPDELDVNAVPTIVSDSGPALAFNGNSGFGQIAVREAVQEAMKRTAKYGVSVVTICNAHWFGALGVYLLPIGRAGLAAHMWVQMSNVRDAAPFGGIDARFGTNPTAICIPTADQPIIADFSTTLVSSGSTAQAERRGLRFRSPAFLDKHGNPSDDPSVFADDGTIMFLGGEEYGYKGYAFSLWNEAIAVIAGGNANDFRRPNRQSCALVTIDPGFFGGPDGRKRYTDEMSRFLAHVKNSRRRSGNAEIRFPGERALQALAEARHGIVSIDTYVYDALKTIGTERGVPVPPPADVEK